MIEKNKVVRIMIWFFMISFPDWTLINLKLGGNLYFFDFYPFAKR